MASGFSLDASVADDHDFLCEDYSSKRARMSCGHTVTAESLTDWCNKQLEDGKDKFQCGRDKCNAVWSFEEVSKLVMEKQGMDFDEKLFKNTFKQKQVKCCPGCDCYVQRRDTNNLSVYCLQCTSQKGRRYEFCWQCMKEWKGRAPRSDRCENEGCKNHALEILLTCKFIEFKHEGLKGVKGCPSVRACPTCGHVLEHNSERCKNIVCPDCRKEFCFVCLKLTKQCSVNIFSCFKPCPVAPRQTSIPVRRE